MLQAVPPASSTTSVSPFAPAAAVPSSSVAPVKLATNGSAGAATSSAARAALEDPAVDDHADLVGERGGVLEVVRDEDRRQRELAEQLVELDPHRRLRVGVERRQRLVEQEDARLERERPRERDALALAARQLADARSRRGARSGTARAARATGDAATGAEAHVREHVEMREQRVLLEEVADTRAAPAARRCPARVEPDAVAERDDADRGAAAGPATTRSTVVFPAPDGPTSAVVAPSATVSWTDASKLRRGWVKWTLSAIG